jgi:membrane-associated phospholipid phosphatase
MKSHYSRLILFIIFFSFCIDQSEANFCEYFTIPQNASEIYFENHFKNDSNFRPDYGFLNKEKGIKSYIAPALLITTGTILHFSTDTKENFRDWAQKNFHYSGKADDYLRFAPLAVVYGLNAVGVKGKNNFGNRTAIVIKSLILTDIMVSGLKKMVNEKRPGGGEHSFPSGHTSVAFAMAQVMHHEYGDKSVWYSIGAYSCATTVGLMRVARDAHWISDVVAGAGFGMLSTELVYLTHQYKWDKEHLRRLDIFPWSNQGQKGLTLVYTF